MFQNGTIVTVIATVLSLCAGFAACGAGLNDGWIVAVDWGGFYVPLVILEAIRSQKDARRGYL